MDAHSPQLIPFDCADGELNAHFARSLAVLRAAADGMIAAATCKMDEFDSQLRAYNQRFSVLKQKLETMKKATSTPLITSPAEFPGRIHVGRPLVFARSTADDPSALVRIPPPLADHSERTKSIKEMILRKNGYRFVFPKGKHAEALQSGGGERENDSSSLLNFERKPRGFVRPERFFELLGATSDAAATTAGDSEEQIEAGSLLIFESLTVQDAADPFTYKPGEGNLTDFDLPEDLPQLPGIAKNIFTNRDSLFGFDVGGGDEEEMFGAGPSRPADLDFSAGSLFYVVEKNAGQRSLHSRSSFDPPAGSSLFKTGDTTSLSAISSSTSSEKGSSVLLPPVPADPPAVMPVAPPRAVPAPTTSFSAPPPPPPPPPPAAILAAIPSPPMPSGRSDLMAAIRAAGGASKAKLKKVAAGEEAADELPPVRPASSSRAAEGGEDLMASLTKALQKRRKVIDGGNSGRRFEALERPKKAGGNATFSSLREIIPPPARRQDSDSEDGGGNEEDWK